MNPVGKTRGREEKGAAPCPKIILFFFFSAVLLIKQLLKK
jgi:hypothetical protein